MIWRAVLLDKLMRRRRISKRRKILLSLGNKTNNLNDVISRTAALEIKEDKERFSKDIVGLERKHKGKDQIAESSNAKLKKQKNKGCRTDDGESSSAKRKRAKLDLTNYDGESSSAERKRVKVDLAADDGEVEPKDMISELPDPILHKILSLLHSSKDLARAGTLSRRWREICSSSFVLRFDQRKFLKDVPKKKGYNREKREEIQQNFTQFRDFVRRSLQNYEQNQQHINTIMLHMTTQDIGLFDAVEQWLNIAAKNHIRELDIHFPIIKKKANTNLKSRFYASDRIFSISTLESLKLCGCKLSAVDLNKIELPNLKKLCLGKLFVSEWMIENIIRRCPHIEHLGFIFCTGVKELRVTGLPKLNKLEVHCCHEVTSILVEAPNLQTFWYHGVRKSLSKIDLGSCTSLKALSLEDAAVKDEFFQELFCSFPFLELLELSRCHSLKSIRISSLVLKRLVLRGCKNLTKTDIDAPNLHFFEFKGNKKPPVSWNPCGLKEAKIAFKIKNKAKHPECLRHADYYWFTKLREFLTKFDASRGLKLLIRWKNGVIIHEDLKEILVPPFFDISIEVVRSSKGCEDILDHVLSSWHPKTLCLVSSPDSTWPQLMLENMDRCDNGSSCCKYTPHSNKCWRHFLKDAQMGGLASLVDETNIWNAWLNKSPTVCQKITNFAMTWMSKKKNGRSSKPQDLQIQVGE